MKPLRTLDRATRRARLIAARPYPIGGIVRRGIIGGQWDRGDVVRQARPSLHFIGFRGDEYVSAVRVWGRPDFIHRGWDRRSQREIAPGDMLVFARGDASQPFAARNYDDIREDR